MKEIIFETIIDSLKLLPFLFVTFLLIELFEHKFSKNAKKIINKCGKFGPVIGSVLGIVPQCGFSVAATNLYITRVISLGTLIAIYLSTSDEMLPILVASNASIKIIITILFIKFISGIIFGYLIDYLFRSKTSKFNYEVCEEEHCDCKHGLIKSSIKHTLNTFMFLIVASFVVNLLFEYTSESFMNKIFMKDNFLGPFIGSLIGLIPNCGASVALTELFLSNAINLGTCISGLLTGSGVGILVLFKSNKNIKENLSILFMLYFIGVLMGIFIELMGILI